MERQKLFSFIIFLTIFTSQQCCVGFSFTRKIWYNFDPKHEQDIGLSSPEVENLLFFAGKSTLNGKIERASFLYEQALSQCPFCPVVLFQAAQFYYYYGQDPLMAEHLLSRILHLFDSSNVNAKEWLQSLHKSSEIPYKDSVQTDEELKNDILSRFYMVVLPDVQKVDYELLHHIDVNLNRIQEWCAQKPPPPANHSQASAKFNPSFGQSTDSKATAVAPPASSFHTDVAHHSISSEYVRPEASDTLEIPEIKPLSELLSNTPTEIAFTLPYIPLLAPPSHPLSLHQLTKGLLNLHLLFNELYHSAAIEGNPYSRVLVAELLFPCLAVDAVTGQLFFRDPMVEKRFSSESPSSALIPTDSPHTLQAFHDPALSTTSCPPPDRDVSSHSVAVRLAGNSIAVSTSPSTGVVEAMGGHRDTPVGGGGVGEGGTAGVVLSSGFELTRADMFSLAPFSAFSHPSAQPQHCLAQDVGLISTPAGSALTPFREIFNLARAKVYTDQLLAAAPLLPSSPPFTTTPTTTTNTATSSSSSRPEAGVRSVLGRHRFCFPATTPSPSTFSFPSSPPTPPDDRGREPPSLQYWQSLFADDTVVRALHTFVFGPENSASGRYRTDPVFIAGRLGAPPDSIPLLMHEFVGWLAEAFGSALHPVEIAALAHFRLVDIHPFADGNGRTARALMNLILNAYGYPSVVIAVEEREAYYQALKDAEFGDLRGFVRFVARALDRTLAQTLALATHYRAEAAAGRVGVRAVLE